LNLACLWYSRGVSLLLRLVMIKAGSRQASAPGPDTPTRPPCPA